MHHFYLNCTGHVTPYITPACIGMHKKSVSMTYATYCTPIYYDNLVLHNFRGSGKTANHEWHIISCCYLSWQ